MNYRLTDLAAALGLSQLRRLAEFKRRRTEITARYNAALADADGLRTPVQRAGVDPIWHLYPFASSAAGDARSSRACAPRGSAYR